MKNLVVCLMVAGLLLAGIGQASAALLVNRGLPTANLNNAAGANRSNVGWVFSEYTPSDYWLVGETFTNTSTNTWTINSIRLWATVPTSTATLWGGVDGSSIGVVSPTGAISATTYAGGTTYQGGSGAYRDIYQIDFAVNIILAPGETYDFYFDGTGNDNLDYQGNPFVVPFVHASNAALSGSPQDGADNLMLYAEIVSGAFSSGSVGLWTSLGDGWDKASDVNVQVYGAPVPEPGTMMLLGSGLVGLAGWGRKKFKK